MICGILQSKRPCRKYNMFNLVAIFRVMINAKSKARIMQAISDYVGKELARIWSPLRNSVVVDALKKAIRNAQGKTRTEYIHCLE